MWGMDGGWMEVWRMEGDTGVSGSIGMEGKWEQMGVWGGCGGWRGTWGLGGVQLGEECLLGDVVIRGVVGLSSPPGGSRGAGRNCGAQEEFWCFLQRRFSLFFPHFWVGKGPHSAREPLLGTTSPIMHRGWGGGKGRLPT